METSTRTQTDTAVALTILSQLGGSRRLTSFVGAKNFVASSDGVSFKFVAKAKDGINYCTVILDPSDTYSVTFTKIRSLVAKVVSTHEGIYCDQLVELFERTTGLFLHF